MLLDFLPDGADECPMLRFSHWAAGEVPQLRKIAEALAAGSAQAVEVHRLPFVQAQGGITFTWLADPRDRGVPLPPDARSFVMQLPPERWADVADVLRPFERGEAGFNWLLPTTDVQVLLSWSGHW